MKKPLTQKASPKLRFPRFRNARGWNSRELIQICDRIAQGGTPDTATPEYWNGGIPWLTPADMGKRDSPYIDSTSRTITPLGLANCSSELLPRHTVLLSTRAPIGHLAINRVPIAINQGLRGLVPSRSLSCGFLHASRPALER